MTTSTLAVWLMMGLLPVAGRSSEPTGDASAAGGQVKGTATIGGQKSGRICTYPVGRPRPVVPQGGVAGGGIVGETEPNDTPGTATEMDLGTGEMQSPNVLAFGLIDPDEDVDYYRFTAHKGDIIGAAVRAENQPDSVLALTDAEGVEILTNDDHDSLSLLYPFGSPLPGGVSGLDSALSWVAPDDGDYLLKVTSLNAATSGSYQLVTVARRPSFEQQLEGRAQIIFLDFNGETLSPQQVFGFGPPSATLSPLADFLDDFGLDASDESAVIDAIVSVVAENLDDLRLESLNGDLDSDGVPGHFAYELRNSRDHADPFGAPNVSRVIIGGTVNEFGIDTIGLAESIDPGNFAREETAVVLLGDLSAPVGPPYSINSVPLTGDVSKIDAVGIGVGNIVVHEIGHYIGNWHTDNTNEIRCLMDAGGFLQANIMGVGPDRILGTGDDEDPDFVQDAYYVPERIAVGVESTHVRSAFALSSGQQLLPDCSATYHAQDFEFGLGRYTIDNGDEEMEGLWHLTDACESQTEGHSRPTAAYFGLDESCDYDSGPSRGWLYSPEIRLDRAIPPVTLSFEYFLESEGDNETFDVARVEMSVNNGPFQPIVSNSTLVGGSLLSDPSGDWLSMNVNIPIIAGDTLMIRWGFDTVDEEFNAFRGFYLDDVEVCAGTNCDPPAVPTEPDPPAGAADQPVAVLLTWDGGVSEPVLITFDEVPVSTVIDGTEIEGVTFSTDGNLDAVVSDGTPGSTSFIDPPHLDAAVDVELTLTIDGPAYGIEYGFAFSSADPAENASTMTLFDADGLPAGTFTADAAKTPAFFAEGRNAGVVGGLIASATITFDHPTAARSFIDNVKVLSVPAALGTGETAGSLAGVNVEPEQVQDPAWRAGVPAQSYCGTTERFQAFAPAGGHASGGTVAGGCPPLGICDTPSTRDNFIPDESTLLKTIRVMFHVFCDDSGNNCLADADDVAAQMATLNENFAPYRFAFVYAVQFINDSTFRQYAVSEDVLMKSMYALDPGMQLNVYLVDNVDGFSFGTFPWDPRALTNQGGIVLTQSHFGAGSTILAHEVGHCIGLWHTHHGVSEVATCSGCYEQADGLNADTTGDLCSDTDPTPVNFSCSPPGGADTCSGTPWGSTDIQNIMGYAPPFCHEEFSPQQSGRFHCWTEEVLSSWITADAVALCPPTFNVLFGESGQAPEQICTDITEQECDPGPLEPGRTYEWQVVATNPRAAVTGEVWSFSTEVACEITGSDPPPCAVDARQPHAIGDAGELQGWDRLTVIFNCDAGLLDQADIVLEVQSGDPPPFGADNEGNELRLVLGDPIPAGQWTCLRYAPGDQRVCWGSLPGDVDGDGTSAPADILALVDGLNGIVTNPEYRMDMDRSGLAGPEDILRVIDLLNGAGAFEAWNDVSLGACPASE